MYLTLTPDKTRFVVGPYTGSEYQKFYVRSFWNGYAINCQVDLGYYNYLTVSANATVKSQYYNGNPKTQFFQYNNKKNIIFTFYRNFRLLGTDVLTLT